MQLVYSRIEQQFLNNASRSAVQFNQQRYSYKDLGGAVARLRGALKERGIKRGDAVAIQLPNSPHFVITHLAVMSLGAVSVPIHVQHKAREIVAQIEESEAVAFVAWDHLAAETEKALARVEGCRIRIYLGDANPQNSVSLLNLISQGPDTPPDSSVSENHLAAILFTSGVSGKARGVELTHGNFTHACSELGKVLRIRDSDRVLAVYPFSSASGLSLCLHFGLASGAELITQSRFHPGDVLAAIQSDGVTLMVGTPYMYSMMAAFPSAERTDTSKLRFPISVDAKLSAEVAREVEEKLKITLFEGYGCTETCGMATINLFPGLVGRENVGQTLGSVEVRILGEDGDFLPPGKEGQIVVRGASITKAYHNKPEKSRSAFREDWFLTGDLGYLDSGANLVVTGHSTEVILKGGFPVYAREVEEVIEGLPHVRHVAVVGIADNLYGEEVKACVVLKEGATISPSEVVEYAKERLAVYKCPKIVKFYKELPVGAGGKILRSELKDDRNWEGR